LRTGNLLLDAAQAARRGANATGRAAARSIDLLPIQFDTATASSIMPLGAVKLRQTPSRTLLEQPRNALGQFAPKAGSEVVPGSIAESVTWDAIRAKPGWRVTTGRVYATDATGQIRVYDGVATSPSGRVIGIETKSGTGRLTPEQRAFDTRLNSSRDNTATGIGQYNNLEIQRAIEVRR